MGLLSKDFLLVLGQQGFWCHRGTGMGIEILKQDKKRKGAVGVYTHLSYSERSLGHLP